MTSLNARILEYSKMTQESREQLRSQLIKDKPYMDSLNRIQVIIKLKALQKVELNLKSKQEN